MNNSNELKIKTKSKYEWTAQVEFDLPEDAKARRAFVEGQKRTDEHGFPIETGVAYYPKSDASIDDAMWKALESVKDRFAAKAKQKGFARESSGLGAHLVNIKGDKMIVEFSMTRIK